MKAAILKKNDTNKIIRKLDIVISEHRELFASWRSEKWPEYEQQSKSEKVKAVQKKK